MKNFQFSILKSLVTYSLLALFFISCQSNGIDEENDKSHAKTSKTKESACGRDLSDFTGTICCVIGPDSAKPGETLSYEFDSNLSNPKISWTVSSGSITVIQENDQSKVKLKFGDDFTSGTILGYAKGDVNVCSQPFKITKKTE